MQSITKMGSIKKRQLSSRHMKEEVIKLPAIKVITPRPQIKSVIEGMRKFEKEKEHSFSNDISVGRYT